MTNRTPAATPRRCCGWMWALRCLVMAAVLWGGPVAADEKDWSRPESEQSSVRWDLLSGYWRDDRGTEFVLTSREGLIEANIWDTRISVFAGRWKPVRRRLPRTYINGHSKELLVVATEERWCASFGKPGPDDRAFRWYRELEVREQDGELLLTADYEIGFYPPDNPLNADVGPMWAQYRAEAPHADGKSEGPWRRITETEAPQWFRHLVALDLIADNRCWR